VFTDFVTGKTFFLRRMSIFQRCLLAWRMTYYAAFPQRYASGVNFIDGDIRGLFTPGRDKKENSDDDTSSKD
jgi:hypothetical protein